MIPETMLTCYRRQSDKGADGPLSTANNAVKGRPIRRLMRQVPPAHGDALPHFGAPVTFLGRGTKPSAKARVGGERGGN